MMSTSNSLVIQKVSREHLESAMGEANSQEEQGLIVAATIGEAKAQGMEGLWVKEAHCVKAGMFETTIIVATMEASVARI